MMGWWIYSWYWGQAGLGCGCWLQLTVSETNGALWLVSGRDPGILLALTRQAQLRLAFTTRDGHWAATTGRSGAERSDNTGHYQMSVRSIMRRSVRMSAPSSGQRTPAATLWMSVRDTGHQAHTILCCLPSVIKIICFQSWLFIQFVKVSNTYVLSWKKPGKIKKNKFNPFIFKCQESSSR